MNHQAEIIAYADDYALLICATLPAILLLAMRKPKPGAVVEAEGDGITSRGACYVVSGGGSGASVVRVDWRRWFVSPARVAAKCVSGPPRGRSVDSMSDKPIADPCSRRFRCELIRYRW